ncbi:hypothetical protein HYH03_012682 [Edaphochlamys debaryana]|uniref:Pherophorin domain-containing protein n=1 Tax=Edaphochlamys debaryana TaxID=47281 RepID=A0A836BTL8_9CHLO|nr:hypothetical protein HYH03_012682 [Edaphochlamys debaryana]|eukprot:KAG2488681.1 hypothetical protein HYH03_012682 [Edaphochlamys debaryana]
MRSPDADPGRRARLPIVALVFSLLVARGVAAFDHSRSLQQSAAAASAQGSSGGLSTFPRFPYCRCETYDCTCSPYKIAYAGYTTNLTTGYDRHCFNVVYAGCDRTRACCAALESYVNKIAFETTAACLKPAVMSVEIRGNFWPSWETKSWNISNKGDMGYELRIYDMRFNRTTFPGSQICVTVRAPCSSLRQLCDVDGSSCRFSIAESADTRYCPICPVINTVPSPPPPSPKPPSPLPPRPPQPPPACSVCAYVYVQPPAEPDGPTWVFDADTCAELGSLMAQSLNDAAQAEGAALVAPFALVGCGSAFNPDAAPPVYPYVQVCGSFWSAEEGAKLQDILSALIVIGAAVPQRRLQPGRLRAAGAVPAAAAATAAAAAAAVADAAAVAFAAATVARAADPARAAAAGPADVAAAATAAATAA